jgi:hypothetical protein
MRVIEKFNSSRVALYADTQLQQLLLTCHKRCSATTAQLLLPATQ